MATIQFHQAVRAKIQGVIDEETERLVRGDYKEYSVYREQVGYLRGLKTVLDIAEEIERGMT